MYSGDFLIHSGGFHTPLFLDNDDIAWLGFCREENLSDDEARILIHARETEMVTNTICREYTGLDTLEVSRVLTRLRNIGLLEQHAHGQATYYSPAERLKNPEFSDLTRSHETSKTYSDSSAEPSLLFSIPAEMREAVEKLGKRSPPAEVRKGIAGLCELRPFTLYEDSLIIHRTRKHTSENYLKPMIKSGELELTIPDIPNTRIRSIERKKWWRINLLMTALGCRISHEKTINFVDISLSPQVMPLSTKPFNISEHNLPLSTKLSDELEAGLVLLPKLQPLPTKLMGESDADSELWDYENVPLKEDIETYMAREILPHITDAWRDFNKTKIGYVVNFNRYFYKYKPPHPLEEREADLEKIENEIAVLLKAR